jgi:hypothetical protein
MNERPILFSCEMVRAILDSRKTITRRVIKPQPIFDYDGGCSYPEYSNIKQCKHYTSIEHFKKGFPVDFPKFGIPGDRLWLRETWSANWPEIKYKSDGKSFEVSDDHSDDLMKQYDNQRGDWRPSIHMPHWASRITLEIVDVRAERLQEISEEDAVREGIPNGAYSVNPKISFLKLWDSINGKKYPWESNPWVWVIEFKKIAA